jgi:carboxypeptidase Taq
LEQRLLTGDLKPADVPGAWNETVEKFLGIRPSKDAEGCLQDIHWSGGLVGYFPTYALGNMYAAQFFETAQEQLGSLDAMFREGEFQPLRNWLNEKIHRHGKRYPANRLVQVVTGRPLSAAPLVKHLQFKFGALYSL